MLDRLEQESLTRFGFEVVLVDSASEDDTADVMLAFAQAAEFPVRVERAAQPGLGLARNIGIASASGAKVLFTDDDCYLAPGYLDLFSAAFDETQFQYGGGNVAIYDSDDHWIGQFHTDERVLIPPGTVQRAGRIQGANMFFLRLVIEQLGGFREDFGAGTQFPAEDVELCTRASLAGYTGGILPELLVYHHHGRRPGSKELEQTLQAYDRGRGGYYACLIASGVSEAWNLWSETANSSGPGPLSDLQLDQLEREMRAGADFLSQELARRKIGS
jgi:glycosyltransferase involved in cell wall biosynthesis